MGKGPSFTGGTEHFDCSEVDCNYTQLLFPSQFSAIMDDMTAVEHVQRQIRANRKPRTALLAEVFGRGMCACC